ncbi:MAG: stage II sporulation protein D [Firmicutes bacterium]|nr:stage II sporulation protein D [Bacillota bacterium]
MLSLRYYRYRFYRFIYSRRRFGHRRLTVGVLLALVLAGVFVAVSFMDYFSRGNEWKITLLQADIGKEISLSLEEYVAGVLAAEMPATFGLEALKAGAVTARTYALQRIIAKQTLPGTNAHVSSDHRVSQAYRSVEQLRATWGMAKFLVAWPKIRLAVTSTRGQVLTYNGQLIDALYHSTSGGVTANSEDYYSTAVPYLRSVPSPWEEHSPYWRTEVFISWQQLTDGLGLALAPQELAQGKVVPRVEAYPNGRTKALVLGEHRFNSRQVRERLGLRSAWFTLEPNPQGVIFHLRGNGHGVGLSQYGADGLAAAGYKYDDILLYYYPGAHLVRSYY